MPSVVLQEPPAPQPARAVVVNGGRPPGVAALEQPAAAAAAGGLYGIFRVSAASFVTYAVLVAILVGAKLWFADHPVDFPIESQATAFEWQALTTIAICGLVGLL